MRIVIDNLDGHGAVDYSAWVAAEGPITIQRVLNAPSRCTAEVVLGAGALPVPARRGRVTVTGDAGTVLFTGYVATEPVRSYAGETSEGAVYRARISAVSDEWLLDKAGSGAASTASVSLKMDAPSLLSTLATRAGGGAGLSVASAGTLYTAGAFVPRQSAPWSVNAGDAAGAAYAGYRAQSGGVLVQTAGTTAHAFTDADGSLHMDEFAVSHLRELANDVTVSGEEEAAAYVSEYFVGDGTTDTFELGEPAFRERTRTRVEDSFREAAIDASQWIVSDPGSRIALDSGGLTFSGGTGVYGATAVASLDQVEMSGTLIAEVSDVVLQDGSDGVLAGFFDGPRTSGACFIGLRVRQQVTNGASQNVMVPVVNGVEVGTVFTPVSGHAYTLRVRLYSPEMQRQMQSYYVMVDGAVQSFGGATAVDSGMQVVFEVVDQGNSSNTPAAVLYDSYAASAEVSDAPTLCSFVVACSTELNASIGAVRVTRPGSMWVQSVTADGTLHTKLTGIAGQGADCEAMYGSSAGVAGTVKFFAGRVPAANEILCVKYRTHGRAVARLQDAASVAREAVGGGRGTSRWLGRVLQPKARSTADCEAAAQALLAVATSRTAALAGRYTAVNPAADVWPGDLLAITSEGVTTPLLVRAVELVDGASAPEVLEYRMRFANDWATEWADGLGLKLIESIAEDAILPPKASDGPAAVLSSLDALAVTSISSTAVQLDAGVDAPAGGGFEVRRRDWAFGVGVDLGDLVLRSPVRSFSVPRSAQVERLYVRMYDGSTPPVYSRWSSVAVVHAPMA